MGAAVVPGIGVGVAGAGGPWIAAGGIDHAVGLAVEGAAAVGLGLVEPLAQAAEGDSAVRGHREDAAARLPRPFRLEDRQRNVPLAVARTLGVGARPVLEEQAALGVVVA